MQQPEQLPRGYGEDTLVAMARDPYNIFVYWELTEETRRRGWECLQGGEGTPVVLRLYRWDRLDANGYPTIVFHQDMPPATDNWWFAPLGPGGIYLAELGMEARGQFLPLMRSRPVATPPDQPGLTGGLGRAVGRNPRFVVYPVYGSHSLAVDEK